LEEMNNFIRACIIFNNLMEYYIILTEYRVIRKAALNE